MSNTIVLKHSNTAGAIPTTGDLERGEIAINVVDGIVYFEKGASSSEDVVSIGHGALRDVGNYVKDMTLSADKTNTGFFYNVVSDITGDATYGDLYEGDWVISTGTSWAHWRNSAKHLSGVDGGYAPLVGGYIPSQYISIEGGMVYKGAWDASAGTPPSTTPGDGHYWIVSVAGNTALDGITDWKIGDWAVYTGTAALWEKIDNTQESVSASQVSYDNTTSGLTASNVQSAIDEVNTTANGKQSDLGTGNAKEVLKTDTAGTGIGWEMQAAADVTSSIIAGTTSVDGALTDLDPRAHTYSKITTGAPDASLGNNGDLCSVTDNSDVTNSVIYQKVNGAWETITAGPGADTFLNLQDVDESTYVGKAGQIVIVNAKSAPDEADGDALIFTDTIDGGTY